MTIEEIVKGMTEDEQAVILCMSDGMFVEPLSSVAADANVSLERTREIMKKFREDGFAIYGSLWNEYEHKPAGSGTWLTKLGFDIRVYIEIMYTAKKGN